MHADDAGHVILDVDDTLVDTYGVGLRKVRRAAANLGLPALPESRYREAYGSLPFHECVASWFPGADVTAFQSHYDALADEFRARPLCDGRALVDAARAAGMGVGILTNGPGHKTESKLRTVGLSNADVDFVQHAGSGAVPKPSPAAFSALQAFDVRPERSWYVSDAAVDWAGAQASGLRTVGLRTAAPTGSRNRTVCPDLVVLGLDELTEMLPLLSALPPMPARRPPRAIGFDAGFTLVDDRITPTELVRRLLTGLDIEVTGEAAEKAFSASVHLLADTSVWAAESTISATLDAFYAQVLDRLGVSGRTLAPVVVAEYTKPTNWVAREGAAAALAAVRRSGLAVGVFSNWQTTLPHTLSATGLYDACDVVVSSAVVGRTKPAPEAFAALAEALGVATEELVYVGDDRRCDAYGMLAAGGRAVLTSRSAPADALAEMVELCLPGVSQPASAA